MVERKEVLKKAIEQNGKHTQLIVLTEELAELVKCTTKILRNGEQPHLLYNMAEEVADVEIMLEQVKMIYPGIKKDIEYFKKCKTERLDKLIRGVLQ